MDGHGLTIDLLPGSALHIVPHGGQIEAFHLVHVVARWLLAPLAFAFATWGLFLVLSLAGWAMWAVFWAVRWPLRVRRSAAKKAPEPS